MEWPPPQDCTRGPAAPCPALRAGTRARALRGAGGADEEILRRRSGGGQGGGGITAAALEEGALERRRRRALEEGAWAARPGLEQHTASRSGLTEVGARKGGAAPSMDAAASRFITAVPDGSQVVPTVVAFLKFTKDLVVSRRRFVALLLSIGGAFAWANSRVSSRERLKVRSSESVGETQLVWSCSRTDCSSRSPR